MANRVNLSIDEDLIKQAKIYALERGKSLSSIFEEYLRKLLTDRSTEKEEKGKDPKDVKTGISWIDQLHGSVKQTDFRSDDEIKWEYLREKYL